MRAKFLIPLAVLVLATSLSCDLFKTRDPMKPSGSQFPCLTLTSPDNIVTNIRQAYGYPDGLGCYVSTLADFVSTTDPGFWFHPDPTDSLEATGGQFDTPWTKTVEERVAESIANSARKDSFRVTLKLPYEIITSQTDLEIRKYAYEIRFNDKVPSPSLTDSLFQGTAEISIRRAGGEWQITDWVDRRDPNGTTSRTWGYLRAHYRVGF